MATPKSWTADDIQMGVMRAGVKDGNLSIIQGYFFIDGSGDEIEVTLTISSKDALEYIMIEDYIPAGCEIINRESGKSWWSHQEFRDEKAVFFFTRYYYHKNDKTIKYRLRAEIPGKYEILPTIATSMYFPDVYANTKSDSITILDKMRD